MAVSNKPTIHTFFRMCFFKYVGGNKDVEINCVI